MSYDGPPIKALTDEWVELFQDEENRSGPMWKLAQIGILPAGVDPEDERVRAMFRPDWRAIDLRLED